jgi:hypothetical protein
LPNTGQQFFAQGFNNQYTVVFGDFDGYCAARANLPLDQ